MSERQGREDPNESKRWEQEKQDGTRPTAQHREDPKETQTWEQGKKNQ